MKSQVLVLTVGLLSGSHALLNASARPLNILLFYLEPVTLSIVVIFFGARVITITFKRSVGAGPEI